MPDREEQIREVASVREDVGALEEIRGEVVALRRSIE